MRRLVVLGLCLGLVPPGLAQEKPDWTIRLSVSPAAAPVPALRYPLLPELRDQAPGNAALMYYRGFSPEWLTHRRPEVAKQLGTWLDNKTKAPGEELRWVVNYRPLQQVDEAARRAYCDWEYTERMRKEGISMVLPDVQSMREFANLLALRARFEMAAGQQDKVLRTLQTGLAMGRHVADNPTLIQALVGVACSAIMLDELERWVEQPRAPNLYWSLTNLPRPFIDLHKPLQGERFWADALFPGLREAMAQHKPADLSTRTLPRTLLDLEIVEGRRLRPVARDREVEDFAVRAGMALYAAKLYPEAKKLLLAQGWKPKEIDALPIWQAALMYELINYDIVFDDFVKWAGAPPAQATAGMAEAERRFRQQFGEDSTGKTLARLLVPAIGKVVNAQIRLDRRIAALRCIEAVRLYAAAHGKLPAHLEDINEVPIPVDPLTGKSFSYMVEGDKVTLSGPPPQGASPTQANTIGYEIILKK